MKTREQINPEIYKSKDKHFVPSQFDEGKEQVPHTYISFKLERLERELGMLPLRLFSLKILLL